MKTPFSVIVLTGLLCFTALAEQPRVIEWSPGLVVDEYPLEDSQSDEDKSFVEYKSLQEPIGYPSVIFSLDGWKHRTERNAIARGYLIVPETGKYQFQTNSFYDRNLLRVKGETVCHYMDGGSKVKTITLEKGRVPIESVGFVNGRGGSQGISVKWKPPGQRELSAIPEENLVHQTRFKLVYEDPKPIDIQDLKYHVDSSPVERKDLRADKLIVVAKDFVIEAYHNGERIQHRARKMLLDRFGSSVEQIDIEAKEGDWLVFHVAHNPLRHGGSKYFAVTGLLDDDIVSIISQASSPLWSVCDSPVAASDFIHFREAGTEARAIPIAKPWEEGSKFMEEYSGVRGFIGEPIWGTSPSTWIKYRVPGKQQDFGRIETDSRNPAKPGPVVEVEETEPEPETSEEEAPEPEPEPEEVKLDISDPKKWPVQIVSAIYGTGGKNADVTEIVREYVEVKRAFFAANPGHLKADPNPYWNKGLHIVYFKDGVRREQRRNENEHILPESFYGPHDAAELKEWITNTRWQGENGEIQFHPHGALAGPGVKGIADWKAIEKNQLDITWPGSEKPVRFVFNYTWSGFSEPKNAKNQYRIMK